MQPNWSLGMILVPIDSIWRQSFRAAKEVPLSLLPAKTLSEKVGIHRWPWRRNENVEGGTLASGTIAVDLGVGTHSCCEIAFELPPQAKEFTTLVGLDRCIGPGACATCKIYADQAGRQAAVLLRVAPQRAGTDPGGPAAGCRLPEVGAGDGVGRRRSSAGGVSAGYRRPRRLADADCYG